MNILGINAWHGDAAACLVRDGELVAAAAEERFGRLRHFAGFPEHAVRFCLHHGGIGPHELDHVAVSRDPSAHMHKKLMAALARLPAAFSLKDRLQNVGKRRDLRGALAAALEVPPDELRACFHNVEHHQAHMASAFFLSPFEQAALQSVDGFGDFVSTMIGRGEGNAVEVMDWVEYPHSLGILYTATSQYLGFRKYGDEGKVMGLAPYGEPRYLDRFREILRLSAAGKFELNLDYFTHHRHGVEMSWEAGTPTIGAIFSARYVDAFGPARFPDAELTSHHQDVAASLQACLEEALFHVLNDLHRRLCSPPGGGARDLPLCLAGGVALNCTANGKIRERTPFQELFIQPAAGDDGTAVGAAYFVRHQVLGRPRSFVRRHAGAGPAEHLMADEIRGANGGAVIARGRLDEQLLERSPLPDLAIGRAVQRHAAGQAEREVASTAARRGAETPVEVVEHVEKRLFQTRLERGGYILMVRCQLGIRKSRRTECIDVSSREDRADGG